MQEKPPADPLALIVAINRQPPDQCGWIDLVLCHAVGECLGEFSPLDGNGLYGIALYWTTALWLDLNPELA